MKDMKYGLIPLLFCCLMACATLSGYIPQIQTTSSHDIILSAAKTFTIVQIDTSGYADAQLAISQRNAENATVNILGKKGLLYLDLSKQPRSSDIWVMVTTKIGKNDYGYYFPTVEIVVFQINPENPEKSIPLWSGNAQMRIQSPSVYQFLPQLLEQLWTKYPN